LTAQVRPRGRDRSGSAHQSTHGATSYRERAVEIAGGSAGAGSARDRWRPCRRFCAGRV